MMKIIVCTQYVPDAKDFSLLKSFSIKYFSASSFSKCQHTRCFDATRCCYDFSWSVKFFCILLFLLVPTGCLKEICIGMEVISEYDLYSSGFFRFHCILYGILLVLNTAHHIKRLKFISI